MRTAASLMLTILSLAATPFVAAQPPDDRRTGGGPGSGAANLAERMMQFDANKDDKLTKTEITDDRLNACLTRRMPIRMAPLRGMSSTF